MTKKQKIRRSKYSLRVQLQDSSSFVTNISKVFDTLESMQEYIKSLWWEHEFEIVGIRIVRIRNHEGTE